MNRVLRSIAWACQPVVIGLALWLALGGPSRDVRAPLVFSDNGLVALVQARSTIERGFWWTVPDFGPQNGDALLFPQNAHLDQVLVRTAHLFSQRAAAVVTMAWALMLMIGGASSAWCLRRLGVSATGAWSAGVLFALCPFALVRNTSDLSLMPYLVPFAATAALQLAAGRWADGKWTGWRGLVAGNALLGLNAVYYAVFGAFLVGVGTIAGLVRSRRRELLVAGAAILAAIVLATALNLAPNDSARPAAGGAEDLSPRPADGELYGLKIRHLVSPLSGHWFEPFRLWSERDAQARFPDQMEPAGYRLGLIATAGFLGLIVVLLVPSAAGTGDEADTIRSSSRLTLAAIALATVGGLGSVFNVLVVPDIMVYARITPFIAFFSLAATALAVDRATKLRRGLHGAVWAGLVVVGLLDQSVGLRPLNVNRTAISDEFRRLSAFVGDLEQTLPVGARIVQLPFGPHPLNRRVERMRPYDHFKPSLVSRTLRWSYPAVSDEAIRWERDAAAVEPRDLPSYLARQGFSAILVDGFAYPDRGVAILAALQADPLTSRPILQDDRYVALYIRERKP